MELITKDELYKNLKEFSIDELFEVLRSINNIMSKYPSEFFKNFGTDKEIVQSIQEDFIFYEIDKKWRNNV